MKRKKKESALKLTPQNRLIIQKIKFYLESHYLQESYFESIMCDIVGMALESQKRGEDFSETVGLDYEEFARELVENAPRQTYIEKIIHIIISTIACLGIVLPVMYVLGFFFHNSTMECNGIILTAPLAFILKYMMIVFVAEVGWILTKRSIYKSQTVILATYICSMILAVIFSDYVTMIKQVYEATVEVNIVIWTVSFAAIITGLSLFKVEIAALIRYIKKKAEKYQQKRSR